MCIALVHAQKHLGNTINGVVNPKLHMSCFVFMNSLPRGLLAYCCRHRTGPSQEPSSPPHMRAHRRWPPPASSSAPRPSEFEFASGENRCVARRSASALADGQSDGHPRMEKFPPPSKLRCASWAANRHSPSRMAILGFEVPFSTSTSYIYSTHDQFLPGPVGLAASPAFWKSGGLAPRDGIGRTRAICQHPYTYGDLAPVAKRAGPGRAGPGRGSRRPRSSGLSQNATLRRWPRWILDGCVVFLGADGRGILMSCH